MSAEMCATCGQRPPQYRKHSECKSCYNRRWVAENRDRNRAYMNDWQRQFRAESKDRTDEMPEFDLAAPIAYSTAHARLAYWRGRAAIHECRCGGPATEWAYRGFSEHEQTGMIPRYASRGRTLAAWSPNPMDYDPLCRSCHVTLDVALARG